MAAADHVGRIAVARQIYNDTVLSYNNSVQTIPSNIVASLTGFRIREFFEIDDDAQREPVKVQF